MENKIKIYACRIMPAVLAISLVVLGSFADAQEQRRSLKEQLGDRPVDTLGYRVYGWETPKVDERRATELGIRKLEGEHLTLYTDLPSSPAVDSLPAIFDQAFPQWCEFLDISPSKAKSVHLTGALMNERKPFETSGILPPSVPQFKHGFAINDRFWMFDQSSDYYRRHLILHEGVHSLMNTVLGSCGPPWYMESTAEYLGTHRLDAEGKVTVGTMPQNRQEVPMWGRIKLIRDAIAAGRARSLDEVLRFIPDAYSNDEAYAWSWAAATLLDRSPETQKIYRGLAKHTTDPQFNQRVRRLLRSRWKDLTRQWLILIDSLEYGHDIPRTTVDMKTGQPMGSDTVNVSVAADRGWQNSGVKLESGRTYRLTAQGRYRIVRGENGSPDWISEPGGVSIRYHAGRPLGLLQAAILPDTPGNTYPLFEPIDVGLETTLTPKVSGTLLLRINDSPAELEENQGEATVQIEAK